MLGGVAYYQFLKDLLADWDSKKDELCERLRDLCARMYTSNNVIASFTGPAQDRERFWEVGGKLGLRQASAIERRLEVPELEVLNEAFVVPSNVCYVAQGSAPSPHDTTSFGTWCIANRLLTYDYLWNEVRVKGGAYGTGFRRTQNGLLQFYSYRDPGIDATLQRYDAAGAWLKNWDATEDEMAGYVVSTVATHDAPQKPRAIARRQDGIYLSRKPEGWRDQVRADELATTPEDLVALADSLAFAAREHSTVVFGSRDIIESSAVAFDNVVELMS